MPKLQTVWDNNVLYIYIYTVLNKLHTLEVDENNGNY